jgi:hypothetical protein
MIRYAVAPSGGSDDFVRMQGAATGSRLIASPSFPLSVVTGCLRAGSDAVDVAAVTSATNKNPTSTACAQKHTLQEESWIHSGTTGSISRKATLYSQLRQSSVLRYEPAPRSWPRHYAPQRGVARFSADLHSHRQPRMAETKAYCMLCNNYRNSFILELYLVSRRGFTGATAIGWASGSECMTLQSRLGQTIPAVLLCPVVFVLALAQRLDEATAATLLELRRTTGLIDKRIEAIEPPRPAAPGTFERAGANPPMDLLYGRKTATMSSTSGGPWNSGRRQA